MSKAGKPKQKRHNNPDEQWNGRVDYGFPVPRFVKAAQVQNQHKYYTAYHDQFFDSDRSHSTRL